MIAHVLCNYVHYYNALLHFGDHVNWDDYRFFLFIARYQTLKLAAKHLHVNQATVGRRLAALQDRIGSRLLEKHSDGYFLTEAGNRVMAGIEVVEKEMLSIDRTILGKDESIEGVVKIAMPGALANQWLIGSMRPLLQAHPKLELQFLTGPEVLNLSRREADLAIRLVRPDQRELKTKRIGVLKLGLYCAKEISETSAFLSMPFVGLFENAMSELEKAFIKSLKFEPQYCMRSAAWNSVYIAVQAGIGIGIMPTFMGDRSKTLRLIQEDKAETPLWLVVHPEVAESGRVRATIGHLSKVLSEL
jgi:DNA-binding transcriptional LysR family regulator